MLPGQQHVFSHQHQYPGEPSWVQQHQQQSTHHPQQHPNIAAQQHAAHAAAAAAAAAQQQHYNRIQGNNNNSNVQAAEMARQNNPVDGTVSEENKKVLEWVADLMDNSRRETALMELSKKREQVPELALIIWHSFGETLPHISVHELLAK